MPAIIPPIIGLKKCNLQSMKIYCDIERFLSHWQIIANANFKPTQNHVDLTPILNTLFFAEIFEPFQ